MKKQILQNVLIPIHFQIYDIANVIKLLEDNNVYYILSNNQSDKMALVHHRKIKQDSDFKKAFTSYLEMPQIKRKRNYGSIGDKISSEKDIIPKGALKSYLKRLSSFKIDPRPIDDTLNDVIERMIQSNFITTVKADFSKYGTKQPLYKLCETDTKKQELDTLLIPAFDATLVAPIYEFHSLPML